MPNTSEVTIPAPFSFAPSQYWNGNDGSWSSFIVRIGTPAQDFEVIPATAGQETLIPLPQGCVSTDPSNCGESRGVLPAFGVQGTGYLTNLSSTWDLVGLFTSNLEDTLGYAVNAEYGFDAVGLQIENSGGIGVNRSVVGGIAAKEFYVGSLGLGPKPSNFTTYNDPQPSFMTLLNSSQQIPSISYGYTAGASYRYSKVLASLTLGGYDSTRFEATNLTLYFGSDDSRPLQVAIQSITGGSTLSGTTSLLPTPIFANIDSTLPYIWLPQAACDAFESAFGLSYDNDTDLYLVNDTIHTQLSASNPTVTFKLSSTLFDGTFQNIELPYAAFDLEARYPIYENATKYFPIRRAANDSQYTLGRTFLQEAYLIADYERSTFTVAKANFSASMPASHIVAIISPGYNLTTNGTNISPSPNHSSLSTGAIAGIAIGVVVILAALILATLTILRRRRHRLRRAAIPTTATATTYGNPTLGADNSYVKHELGGDGSQHELAAPTAPTTELEADTLKWGLSGVQELYSDTPGMGLDVAFGRAPLATTPPKWIHEAEGSPGLTAELQGSEPGDRRD